MISHLPIRSGEKVKLVLLQGGYDNTDVLNQSAYVYSGGILSPAFLPISAKYNDYGSVKDIVQDWNHDTVLAELKKRFGNTIKVDMGSEIEDWTLDQLIDGIERGGVRQPASYLVINEDKPEHVGLAEQWLAMEDREMTSYERQNSEQYGMDFMTLINMKNTHEVANYILEHDAKTPSLYRNWKPLDLSFVMIRQDIWDACVRIGSNDGGYWNDREETLPGGEKKYYITGSEFTSRQWEKFTKHLKPMFTPDQMAAFKARLEADEKDEEARAELLEALSSRHLMTDSYVFSRMSGESRGLWADHRYIEHASTVKEDPAAMQDIYKQWSELYLVNGVISATRRGWMIQPGAGSQHEGWDMHLALAEEVREICEEMGRDEEEEEDDDE
jgi:hypothetical protein